MSDLAQFVFLAAAKQDPRVKSVGAWADVFLDVARTLATHERHEVQVFAEQVRQGDSTYVQCAFAALAAACLVPETPGYAEYRTVKHALVARWNADQEARFPTPVVSLADKVRALFTEYSLGLRGVDGRFYDARFRPLDSTSRISVLLAPDGADEALLSGLAEGAFGYSVRWEGIWMPHKPLTRAIVEAVFPFTRMRDLCRARQAHADAHRWDRPAPPDDLAEREHTLAALEWEMRVEPKGVDLP